MKYFFNIESKQNKTILNVLEIKLIFKKQVISYTYDLGDIIHSFFLFEEEGGVVDFISLKIRKYLENSIKLDIEDFEEGDTFSDEDFNIYHLLLESFYHIEEIMIDLNEFVYYFQDLLEDQIYFIRHNLEDYEDIILYDILESEED